MGILRRENGSEKRARERRRRLEMPRVMFEPRTEAWREAGLSSAIDRADARRARIQFVGLLGLIAGVLVVFSLRGDLFPGYGTEVRIATVVALVILGWGMAKALGQGLAPALFKRMDPGTAGTVGFVIRLLAIALVVIVALRIAGLRPEALAVGGAFTAVVVGLAAQQTLGNVFAGIVLQGTRPFRVGERVRESDRDRGPTDDLPQSQRPAHLQGRRRIQDDDELQPR